MTPVEQDRHDVGVNQQNAHLVSGRTASSRSRRSRIMAMNASTSLGSPSSVGEKSQTGGFKPGIDMPGAAKFRGSTTFAIPPSLCDDEIRSQVRGVRAD